MTDDEALAEEIVHIASVVGPEVDRLAARAGVEGQWSASGLVLVGMDALPEVDALRLPRRPGTVVVARAEQDDPALWRAAMAIGAEHVALLPDATPWLVDRLGELADGPARSGALVVVTSATGGAGTSTLAAALAGIAHDQGRRTALIDGDPLGAGLDLLLGAEDASGIRWGDLAQTHGRLSARTLDYALPHPGGVALLAHPRGEMVEIPAASSSAVLAAARRAYDLVVMDVPRLGEEQALGSADAVLLLVPASVRGIAAAHLAMTGLGGAARPQLVLRRLRHGVPAAEARRALPAEPIGVLPDHPPLQRRADRGERFDPKDAYGKAVAALAGSVLRGLGRAS